MIKISHRIYKRVMQIGILGVVLFSSTQTVFAQERPGTFSLFTIPKYCQENMCGWKEFMALGGEILKFAIFLAILGATLAFVVAGFKMMTNNGNMSEVTKAKSLMLNAVIGIIVTMLAWIIVQFILNQLGVGSGFRLPGM